MKDKANEFFESRNGGKSAELMVEHGESISPTFCVQLMADFADDVDMATHKLLMKPTEQLKPLEDLWRKEHPREGFCIPDRTMFYKWIREKIEKAELAVPAMERERVIEIFKNEFGHQPTTSNKFRLQGIEWLFSKLAPEKPAEVIKENDPNVKLAAGLFKSQSPAEVSDKAKVYYCTICGKNPVDAENGYDTCSECLSRM